MVSKFYIFLLIFFSLSEKSITQVNIKNQQNSLSSNIIVIPFKTFYPKQKNNNKNNKSAFSSLDYYNNFHSSKIFLNLESQNNQYLHIFINPDDSPFSLDDSFSNLYNKECPYSRQLSTTYDICSNNFTSLIIGYYKEKSICGKDNFKLYKNQLLNEYDLTSIEFEHSENKNNNITFSCGKAGLKLTIFKLYKNMNFLNQIHNKINNVDYSFTFKYINNGNIKTINELNEGLFIIGIESYEKEKNIEFNSIYLSQVNIGKNIGWKFFVYNIYIGNSFFDFDDLNIEINPDIDGIEVTKDFNVKLKEYFFKSFYDKGICFEEKIKNGRYIAIYCDSDKFKQEDIQAFPEINFLNNQIKYNFTFRGNDLFQEIEGKLFFKMIANIQYGCNDIVFGKIFLKKYQVIINSDQKYISFYKNNSVDGSEKNEEINNNFANENKKYNFIYIIIFIFIGGLILVFGIFIGQRYCNKKRRIYANELEDNNYVYETGSSKNYSKNKEYMLIDT